MDIALVQTARTPALWSLSAAMVQLVVALSQRGAAGGLHTALCPCECHPSVRHHMAGFPVDVCVNVNREGSSRLVSRAWVFGGEPLCGEGVYMRCVPLFFQPTFFDNHLVVFLFVCFLFGGFSVVFFFFQKKHENFLANLWMIFILKF